MKNNKKLFDKRYKEIMEEIGQSVRNLLVAEGLDIKPRVVSHKLDEMARAAVKRTIDKKAYANAADVIRRHKYDINWAKTVAANPKLDDFQLLHRYVAALLCLKQPCPQTEADIDKIGVFADYAHTLLDDNHTGTIDDIITLYNEQDPIESRGSRTGTARAAKGWRKNNTTTAQAQVQQTTEFPAYDDVDDTETEDIEDTTSTVEPTPAPAPVSKETEEVPAEEFSFDEDDERDEPAETTTEEPSDDEFDFEDEEDTEDNATDADDALDNDSEDDEDDTDTTTDDEEDFFSDDEDDEPVKTSTRSRRSIPKNDDFDFEDDSDDDTDDALDNDSEDEAEDDNMFGDDDDFFSNVEDDDTEDSEESNDKAGRDDTVWGNEAHTEDDEDEDEDDGTPKITDIKAVTYEQYMDPEMNEAFHNFSPNKILFNEDGLIGFNFGVSTDMDDEPVPCSIFRETFGEALKDYVILNQASIDSMDDVMFQFWDEPVIKHFKKNLSKIMSNDDTMDDELQELAVKVGDECFYKAKTAQDVVDYINKMKD